jgi:tetratricopeptide (TPR) repeat protein
MNPLWHRLRQPAWIFLCGLWCVGAWAEPTPQQVAEWKARFQSGVRLVEKGQFEDSLKVFESILEEDANARGSLLMSGVANNHLLRWKEAVEFLEKFLKMQPDHVTGMLAAVQAHQGNGNTDRASYYRDRLKALRAQGKDQRLSLMKNFERERVGQADGGLVILLETFQQEAGEPVYVAVQLSPEKRILRRLEWAPAPPESGQQGYVLGEPLYEKEVIVRYKIHDLRPTLPGYLEAKQAMVDVLAKPSTE